MARSYALLVFALLQICHHGAPETLKKFYWPDPCEHDTATVIELGRYGTDHNSSGILELPDSYYPNGSSCSMLLNSSDGVDLVVRFTNFRPQCADNFIIKYEDREEIIICNCTVDRSFTGKGPVKLTLKSAEANYNDSNSVHLEMRIFFSSLETSLADSGDNKDDSGSNTGAAAGGGVASLVAFILIICCCLYCCRNKETYVVEVYKD